MRREEMHEESYGDRTAVKCLIDWQTARRRLLYSYRSEREAASARSARVSVLRRHNVHPKCRSYNSPHANDCLMQLLLPPLLHVLLALCASQSARCPLLRRTFHLRQTHQQHSSSSSARPCLCSSRSASAPIGPPRSHQTSQSPGIAT